MKTTLTLITALLLGLATLSAPAAEGGREQSLDRLLELVQQGQARDAAEQAERLERFRAQREQQEEILRERRQELARLEALSSELERDFRDNETRIGGRQAQLDERLGTMKELFGVLQQVAGDVNGIFAGSVISSQFPGRGEALQRLIDKAGSGSDLPSIGEIENLWFQMQREIVQGGRSVSYEAPVVNPEGRVEEREVVRVGTFNTLADGRYLDYEAATGKLVELARQPAGRYLSTAEDYTAARGGSGMEDLYLDPSRGSLLAVLTQTPDYSERLDQGGTIGYIIVALGLFALILAGERLFVLGRISARIRRQIGVAEPRDDNPLGRLMATYARYRDTDTETLELRLGETLAQETPRLSRFIPLLKIIAVVAPLMGLLGTVTGMINTFQAITLFGTGDPKLMAGGISQALVTTVLGLAVAIPTVLLQTVVQGRSKRIIQLLEERAVGIIAEHAEHEAGERKPV